MLRRPFVATVSFAAILGSLAWVTAGPINPPPGAVSSTGKTNQQIFDAVQGVGSAASGAGRIAALAGRDEGAGEIEFEAAAGVPAHTTTIVGLTVDAIVPLSGGLPAGRSQVREFTVVRDVGKQAYAPLRSVLSNVVFPEVTVRLANSEGPITYTLKNVRIVAVTMRLQQRTDGTFSQLESMVLAPESLELKTNAGTVSFVLVSPS